MLFRFWVFPDCTFLDISIFIQCSSHHHFDKLVPVGLFSRNRSDSLTIAHYRYSVADTKQFFQFMRNINDPDILCLQLLNQCKQVLYFRICKRRCRLIHHNDFCFSRNSLNYLYHLLLSDT